MTFIGATSGLCWNSLYLNWALLNRFAINIFVLLEYFCFTCFCAILASLSPAEWEVVTNKRFYVSRMTGRQSSWHSTFVLKLLLKWLLPWNSQDSELSDSIIKLLNPWIKSIIITQFTSGNFFEKNFFARSCTLTRPQITFSEKYGVAGVW